jgi:hypothetical protein
VHVIIASLEGQILVLVVFVCKELLKSLFGGEGGWLALELGILVEVVFYADVSVLRVQLA